MKKYSCVEVEYEVGDIVSRLAKMMGDSLVTAEVNNAVYGLFRYSSRKPSNAPELNKVAELVFWTIA